MKAAIFNCQCGRMQNCEGGCETIYCVCLADMIDMFLHQYPIGPCYAQTFYPTLGSKVQVCIFIVFFFLVGSFLFIYVVTKTIAVRFFA